MKGKIKKIITEITFEKAIKLSIVLVILLVGFAVFYHYVIFLPQKEEARLEQQRQEQLAKEQREQEAKEEAERKERLNKLLLDACLSDAYDTYEGNWNQSCERLGKEKDCTLPALTAERWDDYKKDLEDRCFKKYPQK